MRDKFNIFVNSRIVNGFWLIGHCIVLILCCGGLGGPYLSPVRQFIYSYMPFFLVSFFVYSILVQYGRRKKIMNKEMIVIIMLLCINSIYTYFAFPLPDVTGTFHTSYRYLLDFLYLYGIYVVYDWENIYRWFRRIIITNFFLIMIHFAIFYKETFMWYRGMPVFGYNNKNGLGLFIGVVFTIVAVDWIGMKRRSLGNTILLVLSSTILFVSQSDAAIVGGIVVFIICILYDKIFIKMNSIVYGIIISILVVGLFTLFYSNPVLNAFINNTFGKDATLSSRTVIWDYVFHFISQKMWLGHGFGSPLLTIVNEPSLAPIGPVVYHAHNWLLDIVMRIGIPLSITLCGYLVVIDQRIRQSIRFNREHLVFYMLFIFYFTRNILEIGFINENLLTIIMIFSVIKFSNKKEYQTNEDKMSIE